MKKQASKADDPDRDTFIAAVRFMGGSPPRPWWAYTAERKKELAARLPETDQEQRR